MNDSIRILMLEDEPQAAELNERALHKAGLVFDTLRVDTRAAFVQALEEFRPDIALLDFKLQSFDGSAALALLRKQHPEIPAVIVTGVLGDEAAIEMIKAGARDYVLKGNLARLAPAVKRSLAEEQGIRARKAAEAELAARERRFRALVENVSDIIAIIGMDGSVSYISPAVSMIAGYAPEDVLGGNMLEFIHPDEQEAAVQDIAQIIREPGVLQRGIRHLRSKSGDWLVMEYISQNQLANPDVQGIVTILRDVTEQQRAEAAQRESERRFSSLLHNVQLIAVTLDSETRITDCNDYFLNLVGWSREDVLGQNWLELFIPPEAQADVRETMASMLADKKAAWHHQNEILTRTGERRLINWNNALLHSKNGEVSGTSSIGEDITERKRAEQALYESRQLIEGILNAIPVRVFWKDRNLVYQGCNTIFAQDAGFSDPQALIGKDDHQMPWGAQVGLYQADDRAVIDSGQPKLLIEEPQTTPDGRIITLLTSKVPLIGDSGEISGVLGTYTDITELKLTTWALNERIKEQRCLYLIAALAARDDLTETDLLREALAPIVSAFQHPDSVRARITYRDISYTTPDFQTSPSRLACELLVNDTVEGQIEVYSLESPSPGTRDPFLEDEHRLISTVAQILAQALTAKRDRLRIVAQLSRIQVQSKVEQQIRSADALLQGDVEQLARQVTELAAQACSAERANIWLFNEDESELHCIDLYEATPKRHSAGMVLKESEFQNEFHALKSSRFVAADDPLTDLRTTGYIEPYIKPVGITSMLDVVIQIAGRHAGLVCIEHVGPAHHWDNDEISFVIQLADQIGFALTTAQRLKDKRNLQRINRALHTLSAGNSTVVHASTEAQLLKNMCQVVVKRGGYRMAWVGMAESDDAKTVRPVASAGIGAKNYVRQTNISWGDTERGQGPSGRCIRSGESQLSQNIATDPDMQLWRAAAMKHGYQSCLALPLSNASGVFGALMIYSAETDAFDPDEVALLEEMAGDLAYGLMALRTKGAHEQGLRQLERSMEGTVQALASTVEMRDPYTAGHQLRVANLAVAIAREMGLSDARIQGLNLAASIHDIGKIQIPSEILNKPGKLTGSEFSLIKEHAQAGYEILKDVTFPWPIADIIRQHHERLDGSGYPQGLKGEEILLEARILAVADTVEAMSSHRPYRPARGLDAALDLILAERGTKLDAPAVDACVILFRDKGYEMAVWQTA